MKKLFGIKNIRVISLIIVIVFFALGFYFIYLKNLSNTSTSYTNWITYTSSEGNFKILRPQGTVKIDNSDVILADGQKRHEIHFNVVDSDGNLYVVYVSIAQIILDPSLSGLNTFKDELIKQKSNFREINENISKFKDFQSFYLSLYGKEEYIQYRGFSIYNYDYVIGTLSKNKDFPQFDKFTNSFELINAGPNDIKLLRDYSTKAQQVKDYWGKQYNNPKYSKQDIDKVIILSSKIITLNQTILSNLNSKNIDNNNNILLWKQIESTTIELESITSRINPQ